MNYNQRKMYESSEYSKEMAKKAAKERDSKAKEFKYGSKFHSKFKSGYKYKSGSKWESKVILKCSHNANKENRNEASKSAKQPQKIPTSEKLAEMGKAIEACRLDPNTWPLNCRMPRPTSPYPTFQYDSPPTPPKKSPPAPKKSRLVPTPEEDAQAVEVLLLEEQQRDERVAAAEAAAAAAAAEPISGETQARIDQMMRQMCPYMFCESYPLKLPGSGRGPPYA